MHSASQGTTHASDAVVLGDLDGVQSAVFDHDPVPNANVVERVAWALSQARDTVYASYESRDVFDGIQPLPERLSPIRAAEFRIEMARTLAWIAAEPSPPPAHADIRKRREASEHNVRPGHLRLHVAKGNTHVDIQLFEESGRMRLAGVIEASQALRDHSSQIVKVIDPRLLTMLYLVGQHFDAELQVVSGYRVPGVNATRGSRHGMGKACDFRISGVSIYDIANYAESTFTHLGMGIYPTSGFVHMDTRTQTFYWTDRSGPGQRTRTRARSIQRRGTSETDPTIRSVHLTEEDVFSWPRR